MVTEGELGRASRGGRYRGEPRDRLDDDDNDDDATGKKNIRRKRKL